MTATITYTKANASALVALARHHPDRTPRHLKRAFRRATALQAAPEPRSPAKPVPLIPRRAPQHRRVLMAVAAASGLTVDDITGTRRWKRVVDARHAAAWMMRRHCAVPGEPDQPAGYSAIGRWIRRDHSTALYADRKVSENYDTYAPIIEAAERMLEQR